jgi:ATP-dependent Clp protease ATP-binding subunit ClpA
MFERFADPAVQLMRLADEEADRLCHHYVGSEHVLVGLASQESSRVAGILRVSGLGAETVRIGMDRLVACGILPGPSHSNADLLGTLGVDLAAVRQAVEESFGAEAVCAASRRACGRSRLRARRLVVQNSLTGRAMFAKRAFEMAAREADAFGQYDIGPEHLLLGVLADAQVPAGGPWLSRRTGRRRADLRLPRHGPSPVRLIVEANGMSLGALRDAVLGELHIG